MRNPNDANILLKVEDSQEKDFVVLSFDGDLDKLGLESVKKQIDSIVENASKTWMVFDFTGLNFINSESIGFLTTVHYRLIKKDKRLVIIGASDHVFDVLQVIGITQFIKSFANLTAFEDFIKKAA